MARKFESKTVTHPNPRISQEAALQSLYDHPTFPEGGRVASIKRVAGKWEAVIQFPAKEAAPAFLEEKNDAPSDEGPAEPTEDPLDEAAEDEADDKLEKKDEEPGEGAEKIDIQQVFDLVKAIADKVGVVPHGDEGEEHELGPHADGPPPPPPGPAAPPAGAAPKPKPPLRPGMAPGGATPVGAPSFAATKPHEVVGKVRSFVVSDVTDAPLEECKTQIEAAYGEHGYKVRQIVETTDESGNRKVRAKISV
jgi:hypothetical protein